MDQTILVADRIDDGKRLVDALPLSGFAVSAAFWIYSDDDNQWSLDIVSPTIDSVGMFKSYLTIIETIKQLSPLNLKPDDVSLLRPGHPLAEGFVECIDQHPEFISKKIWGFFAGKIRVDEAYVYPRPMTN